MRNLILASILLLTVTLSGCASSKISEKTQIVEVPIKVKCQSSIKVDGIKEYPFDRATKDMSLFDKYQLSSAERKLLRAENLELRAALMECTK